MGCLAAAAAAITNSCTDRPTSGLESVAYIMNRSDLTATADADNPALITGLALAAEGNQAYEITAVKKENNAGFDAVIADNLPNLFTHYYAIQPYERDSDAVQALDTMDDIVIVVELKGPKAEGKFVIFGLETGLHLTSASGRANDNNGVPTYEYQTLEGEQELYSRYIFWSTDYDTTKAALVDLLTPTT